MKDQVLYSKVFAYHAKNGVVEASLFPKLIRCCGFAPTQQEMTEFMQKYLNGKKSFTEEEFLKIVGSDDFVNQNSKNEIFTALLEFNKLRGHDSDFISVDDLQCALLNVGANPMKEDEFKRMMDLVDTKHVERNSKGDIHITSFIEKVLLIF